MLRETRIETGIVRGVSGRDHNITSFKGIPFAAPPVGENRWREPQPAHSWDGVRDCRNFGNIPMQEKTAHNKENPSHDELIPDEDCLYINVWTPAQNTDEKLPVLFWIFGGAYMFGSPAEIDYDGENLARHGVIVVSVSYRVNVFSWFAHKKLTEDERAKNCGYTDFGFLDQRFGMMWVKRNISAFGGDPNNVTIFGHSAGGGSVLAHLCSSINKGFFEKAIVMSGGGIRLGKSAKNNDLQKAESTGEDFIKWLGFNSYEDAKKLSAKELYDKSCEYAGWGGLDEEPGSKKFKGFVWTHLTDGYFLEDDWTRVLYENKRLPVPVMCGNAQMDFPFSPRFDTTEEFEKWARDTFEDRADEYLRIVDFACGDIEKIRKNATYSSQSQGTLTWCKHEERLRAKGEFSAAPKYVYCFDERIPLKGTTETGDPVHGTEVSYAFDNVDISKGGAYKGCHFDIAKQMSSYYVNFAKTGDPNGDDCYSEKLPLWEPYSLLSPCVMNFKGGAHMSDGESELMKFLIDWSLDWHKNNP